MFDRAKKRISLLIDPENTSEEGELIELIVLANKTEVDFIFVGGSLVTHNKIDQVVKSIKSIAQMPVILFPGGLNQISAHADAILFLSLISGRNPEYLISKQVAAAPLLKQLKIKVIPTGYMLIGTTSSASYMSSTSPIPYHKNDIASATAMAGEMMGHQAVYLDAGSGAPEPVRPEMIEHVKKSISVPLIVGGAIKSFDLAYSALEAGADVIVVGNAIEENPNTLEEIAGAVKASNTLNVH